MRSIKITFLLCLAAFAGSAQITIDEANAVQQTPPTQSFLFTSEVILKPGFSVSASTVPGGQWYCRTAPIKNIPQDISRPFVRIENILKPGVTNEYDISKLLLVNKATTYTYVDGIGRPSQTVNVQSSPAKRDVIRYNIYDGFGREPSSFLPYTIDNGADNEGGFRLNPSTEQASYYTYGSPTNPLGVATNTKPYNERFFDNSPVNRVVQTYGPGSEWRTSPVDKSVTSTVATNSANEVYRLTFLPQTALPVASKSVYHNPNTLVVSVTVDEDNLTTKTYTDFQGAVVLQRRGDGTVWHDTYYVYDFLGNIAFIFPPEATSRVFEIATSEYIGKTANEQQAFLDTWCFRYAYDQYGRTTDKKFPGAGWVITIYDRWDRPVLVQDAQRRLANEWLYTKYDIFNRPILTGITTGARATLETSIGGSTARFESRNTSSIGYTNGALPLHTEQNLLTINYYDDYTFLTNAGWDAEGLSYSFVNDFSTPNSTTVKGYATGAKIKNLGTNTWLNSVVYLDANYRPIQTIMENHLGGTDRTSSLLSFTGKVMSSKRTHASPGKSLTVLEDYTYDHSGRLLNTYHQIGSGPRILLASNKYNEIGQLIEKNFHSLDNGVTFLQSMDRRYNIRGWITSINNSGLTNDGVKNNDVGDIFGMELLYNDPQTTIKNTPTDFATVPKYNGNIAAIKWKTDTRQSGVTPPEQIYGFKYDALSRFNNSYYATNNSGLWTGNPTNYNESVVGYDKNGNIGGTTGTPAVALSRKGTSNNQTAQQIDNLTYRYTGNQLKNVVDGGNAAGFKNNSLPITSDEFAYDANGNLIMDMNKSIEAITYNHFNQPTEIRFTVPNSVDGNKIEYTYDASGNKLRRVVWVDGDEVWTTDYVGGIQIDEDKISFVSTAEGRAVRNGTGFDYEYFYQDHQSNTRVVYGSLKETQSWKATMELNLSTQENAAFRNINSTRIPVSNVNLNYTKSSEKVLVPDRSAETNSFTGGQPIGPAKSIPVSTGDKVYVEVYGKYTQTSGSSAKILTTALISALTGPNTFNIPNAGETAQAWQGFNTNAPNVPLEIEPSTVVPRGYLAYLFFDTNHVYQRFGVSPITDDAYNSFEKLFLSFTADKNGFLYIYTVNESAVNANVDVYYDDMYILHEKGNAALQVLQSSDYYPLGLSFNEYTADRIVEESPGVYAPALRNRYLFQNQELQKDLDLGWYAYRFRMHDPAIGRFGAVDPLSEKYDYNSTYAFSENKLISHVELEGLESYVAIYRGSWEDGWELDKTVFRGEDPYDHTMIEFRKDLPSWINDALPTTGMIDILIDKSGTSAQIVIKPEDLYEYETYSKHNFSEDVSSVVEAVHFLGYLADENLAPWTRHVRDNLERVEVGFSGTIGTKAINVNIAGGSFATKANNMGGFFRGDYQFEVNNQNISELFDPEISLKFFMGFKMKSEAGMLNHEGAVSAGPVEMGYSTDGVYKISIGFGGSKGASIDAKAGSSTSFQMFKYETDKKNMWTTSH